MDASNREDRIPQIRYDYEKKIWTLFCVTFATRASQVSNALIPDLCANARRSGRPGRVCTLGDHDLPFLRDCGPSADHVLSFARGIPTAFRKPPGTGANHTSPPQPFHCQKPFVLMRPADVSPSHPQKSVSQLSLSPLVGPGSAICSGVDIRAWLGLPLDGRG